MNASPAPVILVTTDSALCGTERQALALARALDRSRYLPMLIALKGPGDLIDEARTSGIDAVNLELNRNPLRGLWRWREALKRHQPFLLHSFLFHSNLLARATRAFNMQRKVISGIRTVYSVKDYGRLYGTLERWTHGLDDLYVANSDQGLQSAIDAIRLPEARLRMVPNGIEIDPFDESIDELRRAARDEFGFRDEQFVIGMTAQLRPAKRHDLLLNAFARLAQRHEQARLLVIGGGERQADLEAMARSLGVGDLACFTGYRNDARRLLRSLDAFALPSDIEGIPVSVMEAMEAALPIAATRVGGIPDLIEHEQSGLLFDAGDEEGLFNALTRLIESPERGAALAANARERVIARFSVDAMARRFEALYDEALA